MRPWLYLPYVVLTWNAFCLQCSISKSSCFLLLPINPLNYQPLLLSEYWRKKGHPPVWWISMSLCCACNRVIEGIEWKHNQGILVRSATGESMYEWKLVVRSEGRMGGELDGCVAVQHKNSWVKNLINNSILLKFQFNRRGGWEWRFLFFSGILSTPIFSFLALSLYDTTRDYPFILGEYMAGAEPRKMYWKCNTLFPQPSRDNF